MTSVADPAPLRRRGVLVAEIVVLVVAGVVDLVLEIQLRSGLRPLPTLLTPVVPAAGEATAVLVVLRRRFPDRLLPLGLAIVALSLASTLASVAIAAAGQGTVAYPGVTEVVAMALLVGGACRRLPPTGAAAVTAAGALAMLTTALLRYGIGSPVALLAVPTALLWGIAVAIGLILRDADARRRTELATVRENERVQLARELHDLVAHHVSGIVVRAQAARAMAGNPVPALAEIEQAGAEALDATRQLVGLLRSDSPVALLPGATVEDAIRTAVADHDEIGASVDIDIGAELRTVTAPPEMVITAHRVVLEALTNVRRHAVGAAVIEIRATVDNGQFVLDVHDDGRSGRPRAHRGQGYGLVGMTERVAALGGRLRAGPDRARGWRLTAMLPLHRDAHRATHPHEDTAR